MRMRFLVLAVTAVLASVAVAATSTLDVGLLVNGATEVVSYVGWPLLFEVSFADQAAFNDAMYNQHVEIERAELQALLASGEITEAEAERVRATLVLRDIEPLILGAEGWPWTALVSFMDPEGSLGWSIALLAKDVPPSLRLEAGSVAVAWYGLDAEASATLVPGTYDVVAAVSTEGVAPSPDEDVWTGTGRSSPVRVDIRAEPAPTGTLLKEKWIAFGRYALYAGEAGVAEGFLTDAVALGGSAVGAWILLGDAQYAQGKLESALASFEAALDLVTEATGGALAPHAEPPTYILLRIAQIQDELGMEPATEG